MIWFFDRDGEKLRYEISHDRLAGRYRVIITHPDGTESVEESKSRPNSSSARRIDELRCAAMGGASRSQRRMR
jgi:hypothetical protein